MANVLTKFLYYIMVLTAVCTTPKVENRVVDYYTKQSTLQFKYPNVLVGLGVSFFVSVLAVFATHRFYCFTMNKALYVMLIIPWILICHLKFAFNAVQLFDAVLLTGGVTATNPIFKSFCLYCVIYGMALEMMLHWCALFRLQGYKYKTHIDCPDM